MNSMRWIAAELARGLASRYPEPTSQPRFNPRPPGVIREGSATWTVLNFLAVNPGKYWNCYQLCQRTGFSIKAVNHACLFLRKQELIQTCPDPRNVKYLRYAILPKGQKHATNEH
jgi:hypothetical protein